MNGQSFVVIVNKSILPELIHEMTDPRPGCTDHFCECILAYPGNNGLGFIFLAEMRKQQKNPSQTLFAGVEKVVHEVRFVSDVAQKQMIDKQFRNIVMFVKDLLHQRLFYPVKRAIRHRSGCCKTQYLSGEASLAEEFALAEDGDYCFFSLIG